MLAMYQIMLSLLFLVATLFTSARTYAGGNPEVYETLKQAVSWINQNAREVRDDFKSGYYAPFSTPLFQVSLQLTDKVTSISGDIDSKNSRLQIEINLNHADQDNPEAIQAVLLKLDLMQIDLQFPKNLATPDDSWLSRFFTSPLEWYEVTRDANAGDAEARAYLEAFDKYVKFEAATLISKEPEHIKELQAATVSAMHEYSQLAYAKDQEMRALQGAFEQKFRQEIPAIKEAVANNDRVKTRDLFENVLPISTMPLTRRAYWRNFLNSLTPDLNSPRQILLRGTKSEDAIAGNHGSYILSNVFNFDILPKMLARHMFPTLDKFMMSMDTSRAESLKSKLGISSAEFPPLRETLYKFFYLHTIDTSLEGGTFISTTTDLQIARSFMKDEIVVLKIDARRIMPNIFMAGLTEHEVLVPMLVFPDEIVKYETQTDIGSGFEAWDEFKDDIKKLEPTPSTSDQTIPEAEYIGEALKYFAGDLPGMESNCQTVL